jgi:hypothetical protein
MDKIGTKPLILSDKSHIFRKSNKNITKFSAFFLPESPEFYILWTRTLCSPPNPQKTSLALLG